MGHTQASRVLLFLNDHLGHDMFLGIRILHQKIERLLIYETESDWKYLRGIKKKKAGSFFCIIFIEHILIEKHQDLVLLNRRPKHKPESL